MYGEIENKINWLNCLKRFKMKIRLTMAKPPDKINSFLVFILVESRVVIKDISDQLRIPVGTAFKIVHDELAFLRSIGVEFSKYWCQAKTMVTISQFYREQLKHLTLCGDQVSSYFHLFGSLKEESFPVKSNVSKWLNFAPKDFYTEGIQKLVFRWEKRDSKNGDYTEE